MSPPSACVVALTVHFIFSSFLVVARRHYRYTPPALPTSVAAAASLATAASAARARTPVAGPSAVPFTQYPLNIRDWCRPFGACRLLDDASQQQDLAADLNSRIQLLERRADMFEEWKRELEERLKAAGL